MMTNSNNDSPTGLVWSNPRLYSTRLDSSAMIPVPVPDPFRSISRCHYACFHSTLRNSPSHPTIPSIQSIYICVCKYANRERSSRTD